MMNNSPKKKKNHLIPTWFVNTIIIILIIGLLGWWQYPNILHHIIEPMIHKQHVKTSLDNKSKYDDNKNMLDKYVKATGVDINNQNYGGYNEDLENKLKNLNGGVGKSQPNLTYDYSNVQPFDENKWNNINPKYDKRLLVGHIRIPAISVNLPVLEGVSNTNLYVGAGTLKPYQQLGKGNYALASHHMPDEVSNFSRLGALQKGNQIYISNSKYIYQYSVDSVKTMPPRSGNVVNDVSGKRLVTLVTCTDIYATNRIVVQGHYVGKHSFNSDKGQKYFKY